jgi:hypothetical protein
MRLTVRASIVATLIAARGMARQDESTPQGDQFACALAAGCDLDGDGIPDAVIADATDPSRSSIWFVSGCDGSVLFRGEVPGTITGIDLVGDVDGDGVSDVAAVSGRWNGPTFVELLSGRTGTAIRRDPAECWAVGRLWTVRSAGSIDADGCHDLLVECRPLEDSYPYPGSVLVVCGKDGRLIRRFENGIACTGIGDVDSDGRSDFAISYFGRVTSSLRYRSRVASIVVYSGGTGAPLFEILGDTKEVGFDLALGGGADLDGDGCPDLLVGAQNPAAGPGAAGRVRVYSGRDGSQLRAFDRSKLATRIAIGDSFGENVRFLADLNGDGIPEILVGAPEDGAFEGTAYVLSGIDGRPIHWVEGRCGYPAPNEPDRGDHHVGRTLARAGDLDRDGIEDFIVGNCPYDGGQFGLVRAFSGKSGKLLWSIDRDAVVRSQSTR